MQRVLLVTENPHRAKHFAQALVREGYTVVATLCEPALLPAILAQRVVELRPQVLVVESNDCSDAILDTIRRLSESQPCAIVLFSSTADRNKIRAAARAGVSAHVVNNSMLERLAPVIEAAIARFELLQELRTELAGVNTKLVERKLIERAKGIVMRQLDLSEEAAYRALRTQAMEQKLRIVDLAQQIISVSGLLTGRQDSGAAPRRAAPDACESER